MWVAFPGRAVRRITIRWPAAARSPVPGVDRHAPATLELVASTLDAGLAPAAAIAAVAASLPSQPALRRASAMVDISGEPAWRALVQDAEVGQLAAAIVRSQQSGAPVATSTRVLAEELRRTHRAERMNQARRVGVRTAAPLGLCFLPAFFVVAVVPTVLGLLGRVL
jgi:pilus assembly protein TadC